MKELNYRGRKLIYETTCDVSEYGDSYTTTFYDPNVIEITRRRKWILFGDYIIKETPKELFTIYANSMDSSLLKGWWSKRLDYELEKLERIEQLNRGELA